jgi:hypothetical protein
MRRFLTRYALAALFFWQLGAFDAHAAEVEAVVIYDHTSALSRGYPFNDQDEWSVDFVGAGITITAGKRRAWEIDLAHGRKMFDNDGQWEEGSKVAVRWYPGRGR